MFIAAMGLVCSYLIGAFPTSFLVAKFWRGIDIRAHGSGNPGATNAYRVMGKGAGTIVLLSDILKGALCVLLLPRLFFVQEPVSLEVYTLLIAGSVVIGHMWTIFLGFKGGKGIATSAGVMWVLAPKALLVCALVWVIVFLIWRYVSLASISAAILFPVAGGALYHNGGLTLFISFVALLTIIKHKGNIIRLMRGEELGFGKKK